MRSVLSQNGRGARGHVGASDTVGMAANFLQQTVYVIQHIASPTHSWSCSKYAPTTVSFHNRVAEMAAEYQLTLLKLMDEVVAAKTKKPAIPPLILQYRERHYSAFF